MASRSVSGVGQINHDGRSGYWHPPKRLGRRQKKRVRRPEPWWPCEAFSFSLLKAPSSKEIAAGPPYFRPISKKTHFCDHHHIASATAELVSTKDRSDEGGSRLSEQVQSSLARQDQRGKSP